MNIKKGYALVIDTNEYAGNFERELTAFCTGIIGECEEGKEYVFEDITDIFEESIQQCPDDSGTHRPCEAISNGKECNSVAVFFYEKPTDFQIQTIKHRAGCFNEHRKIVDQWNPNSSIEILGFRLLHLQQDSEEIEI